MLNRSWVRYVAVGLIAVCISSAYAAGRVTYNKTVLDCVYEGCFVVRYVPAPRLKPNQQSNGNAPSESAEKAIEDDKEHADESVLISVSQPEPQPERSDPDSPEDQEKDGRPIKRRTIFDWIFGLFDSPEDWTAWGTIAAAAIAGIAVWLLCQTLRATRFATRLTGEALIEAKRTTAVTRKMGMVQSQAYLVTKGGEYWPNARYNDPTWPQSFYFKIFIANKGNSPAKNIRITDCSVHFMEEELDHYGGFTGQSSAVLSLENAKGFSASIGPSGEEFTLIWMGLENGDYERIKDIFFHITISGEIYWENEFEKTQSWRFAVGSEIKHFSAFKIDDLIDEKVRLRLSNIAIGNIDQAK